MKKFSLIALIIILFGSLAQAQTKTYISSGSEMIFSFAAIDHNGKAPDATLRWAPFFNFQSNLNADFGDHFGLFGGFSFKNVGYIYDGYIETVAGVPMTYKKKFRSYNAGIPVGFKLGNLRKFFLYGGYEVEVPVHYKEKTFDGSDKIDKISGWFSDRQQMFQHGFIVGVQFPYGLNLKFKYYLSEFHNQDYVDEAGNKPYSGLQANVFYFSLSSSVFKQTPKKSVKPTPKKLVF
jgi:hypothetical protein